MALDKKGFSLKSKISKLSSSSGDKNQDSLNVGEIEDFYVPLLFINESLAELADYPKRIAEARRKWGEGEAKKVENEAKLAIATYASVVYGNYEANKDFMEVMENDYEVAGNFEKVKAWLDARGGKSLMLRVPEVMA